MISVRPSSPNSTLLRAYFKLSLKYFVLFYYTKLAMFCRVSGELNGESILGEDLNCYVVTEDGR